MRKFFENKKKKKFIEQTNCDILTHFTQISAKTEIHITNTNRVKTQLQIIFKTFFFVFVVHHYCFFRNIRFIKKIPIKIPIKKKNFDRNKYKIEEKNNYTGM